MADDDVTLDLDPGDEDPRRSPALENAIRLRRLVRQELIAIELGSGSQANLCRLNQLADEAYVKLGPLDASGYIAWARSPDRDD